MHHLETSGTQAAANVDRVNYSTHTISTFISHEEHKKISPPQQICFITVVTMRNYSFEQNSDNLFIIDIAMGGQQWKEQFSWSCLGLGK